MCEYIILLPIAYYDIRMHHTIYVFRPRPATAQTPWKAWPTSPWSSRASRTSGRYHYYYYYYYYYYYDYNYYYY